MQQHMTSAKVDVECPQHNSFDVYFETYFYNITLSFCNYSINSNKYVILQLLMKGIDQTYYLWYRCGRLGSRGKQTLIMFGSNLEQAKSAFEVKFYEKTRNSWSNIRNFERDPSMYSLVESAPEVPIPPAKLDIRIQNLLDLMCSNNLKEAACEMFVNFKIPLGPLSENQIKQGYAVLANITKLIKENNKEGLIEACNEFYAKIPHAFGRRRPPLITTGHEIKEKMELLQDLLCISLSMTVRNGASESSENIIDLYYENLQCSLLPLEHTSDKFAVLRQCLLDMHGSIHSNYKMELIEAFECLKDEQESSFLDFGNKELLWHGSRISNWIGILKKGLLVAPCEAIRSGSLFGQGIYFTDVSSKAANYCLATRQQNEGVLLLCEVSLGTHYYPTCIEHVFNFPVGCQSVAALGNNHPRRFEKTVLSIKQQTIKLVGTSKKRGFK